MWCNTRLSSPGNCLTILCGVTQGYQAQVRRSAMRSGSSFNDQDWPHRLQSYQGQPKQTFNYARVTLLNDSTVKIDRIQLFRYIIPRRFHAWVTLTTFCVTTETPIDSTFFIRPRNTTTNILSRMQWSLASTPWRGFKLIIYSLLC